MFRKNLTIAECAALIEVWEVHRCADGYENVFDLKDGTDFRLMVGMRGLLKTIKMRRQNRYWFDGINYKEPKPFPMTAEGARELAEKMIEPERIQECPWLYAQYR